ncbi:27 kDa hemolymph protein-like [Schistocerca serialis cubense]|uniref:27 kDa hemolymph protein-like n=1 Tax=Schistocerca serialis cubense TaxID=2023355 RepID=UPI00214E09A9|nr:27 kDa hemolymph protein-like [Schistocerca serialis cubense]
MKFLAGLLFIIGGLVCAEISSSDTIDTKELAKNVQERLSGVTKIPTSVDDIPQETVEELVQDTQMKVEEKCRKVGGEAAFLRAQNAKNELMDCIQNLINITELQQKVEDAKPVGKLDEVSREYCHKSPVLKNCIQNFTDAAEGCLEEAEKESVRTTLNITNAILDFICHKQGDRIALFIAEGGQDCLNKTSTEIQECMNSTLGKLVPQEKSNIESLPQLVLGEKECVAMQNMQTCTVNVMEEKCAEPTPANIIESMFRFIIKMTPCAKWVNEKTGGAATAITSVWRLIVASVIPAVFLAL